MSTVSNLKISDLQTAPAQVTTDALVQDLFNKQRAYFATEGEIVEHWDVLQPAPASSNNPNTMF